MPSQVFHTHPVVAAALKDCRRAFWSIAVFSGVVNLLMLAGPIYMLQVYDRVLGARSLSTLVALSIFLVGAYAFQGTLDAVRGRVVVRAATLLDLKLSVSVHEAVLRIAVQNRGAGEAYQPVRDLDRIRAFLMSPGPIAIVDLPWVPLFLAICFVIHTWLGILAVAGGAILLVITILTEKASITSSHEASRSAALRGSIIESDRRNSETAVAMGMSDALVTRWTQANDRYLAALGRSSDVVGTYGSISKVVRMLLQSAILGLGAYLVIRQELTAGAMIAASIMVGRALAPVETAIANWRTFLAARHSIRRLSGTLARLGTADRHMALPAPFRSFNVENLYVSAPGMERPIVRNVHFQLIAGDALGIIGPSGSGKTSLVRTLVGVWPLISGTVRFDDAAIDQWDQQFLGRHIGFVSQSVELFDGTIAQNISRMAAGPDSELVIKAARAAGAHEMILRMTSGYDTRVGDDGEALSAGQRQRLALARALYGDPFLIVLDEPNSNLDNEGELSLQEAIRLAKARLAIVIIIAHRPSAVACCNKLLFLKNGTQHAYGSRDDVLRKISTSFSQTDSSSAKLQSVRDVSSGAHR